MEVAGIFGARSWSFERRLQAAKHVATDTLKFRPAEKGANAVIGIDLNYVGY